MKATDLMLDIETLGREVTAPVVQIALVPFDRYEQDCLDSVFYKNPEYRGQFDFVELGTLEFWLEQEKRPTWLNNRTLSPDYVAKEFSRFVRENNLSERPLWCHASFDVPILRHWIRYYGQRWAFHYRAPRDIRTLIDIAGGRESLLKESEKSENASHDALDDCYRQIQYVCRAMKKLGVV